MKQLSGVDASFLYMETGTTFGHVSGLSIFRRPDDPDWSAYDHYRRQLERRLPVLEPLRRRVIEVPLQIDHPYWIEDPDFDIGYHLRETEVPPPGDDSRLSDLVSRIIGRPLDRAHPLWETYIIEGLDDDRFAVLTKFHHASIDGASGAELMTILFDAEEHPTGEPDIVDTRRPEPVPTPAEVMARAMVDVARKPRGLLRLQIRTLRAVGELTRNRGLTGLADLARSLPTPLARIGRRPEDTLPEPPSGSAPPTPFNRAITPHRRLALRTASLSDVKAIKNALGATLNDVVMAVCAGALRQYLAEHDVLPAEPLVAMIPVSIRTGEEEDVWTNRVSSIFATIPTDLDDPAERVRRVHEAMGAAKDRFALIPADVLTDYTQFSPPALATRALRMATRFRIADRMNPPFNLVISNVPGPRHPLYLGGSQLLHYYPVSTITEGQGLNITVQSYLDNLDFGLVGCRELLPDLDHLADLLLTEVEVLAKAAGVEVTGTEPDRSEPDRSELEPSRSNGRRAEVGESLPSTLREVPEPLQAAAVAAAADATKPKPAKRAKAATRPASAAANATRPKPAKATTKPARAATEPKAATESTKAAKPVRSSKSEAKATKGPAKATKGPAKAAAKARKGEGRQR